jgi:hypothetical protein
MRGPQDRCSHSRETRLPGVRIPAPGRAFLLTCRGNVRPTEIIRIVLCGLVAGVVWHLLSAMALGLLAPDVMPALRSIAIYPGRSGAFFYAIDVAMGIWAVWLYAAISARYGPGVRTAALAGLAWWTLRGLQSAKWAGLGFLAPGTSYAPLAAGSLLAALAAALTGAWLYDVSSNEDAAGAPRIPAE